MRAVRDGVGLIVLAFACMSGVATAQTSAQYQPVTVKSVGVQFLIPAGWTSVPATRSGLIRQVHRLTATNPTAATALERLANSEAGEDIRFNAADLASWDASVSVVVDHKLRFPVDLAAFQSSMGGHYYGVHAAGTSTGVSNGHRWYRADSTIAGTNSTGEPVTGRQAMEIIAVRKGTAVIFVDAPDTVDGHGEINALLDSVVKK
jgi:hypothetical protein